MSNRVLDATGDTFTEGCTPAGNWSLAVRSAYAGDPALRSTTSGAVRTPAIGRGSDFASVPHAAGYLCLCHAETGLQLELKQDSNGWFALRGGGSGGSADEPCWDEPGDAVVWSDGRVQTHAEGAGMRVPATTFARQAARRRGRVLQDVESIGAYRYGLCVARHAASCFDVDIPLCMHRAEGVGARTADIHTLIWRSLCWIAVVGRLQSQRTTFCSSQTGMSAPPCPSTSSC